MKTILDEGRTWFLDRIHYRSAALAVVVAEGFRSAEPRDLHVGGHVFRDTFDLGVDERSRFVEVRFESPVSWQVVDESFTTFDEYEQREDDSALQVLTRSKYLDYVHASHGWFVDVRGPAKHYRVWTEDEVVDVVSCEPPVVSQVPAAQAVPSRRPG